MLLRALRKALAVPARISCVPAAVLQVLVLLFFVDCTSRLGLFTLSGKRPSGTGRDAAPRRAQQQAYRRRIVVVIIVVIAIVDVPIVIIALSLQSKSL